MIGIKLGIIFSMLSVILGAFGAHGLKEILSQNNTGDIFQTGVRYHMLHSIATYCMYCLHSTASIAYAT